jgi:hypothetical protein
MRVSATKRVTPIAPSTTQYTTESATQGQVLGGSAHHCQRQSRAGTTLARSRSQFIYLHSFNPLT